MKISPEVLLVAISVPIAVSISAAPAAPMPCTAVKVAVPEVVRFGVSRAVLSEINPPAVTRMSPEVLISWLSKTLPLAL